MTATTTHVPLGPARCGPAQRRLLELAAERQGHAGWWVEVNRQLDHLAEAVAAAPGDLADALGLADQLRSDAPHLLGRWHRVARERERLHDEVRQVRLLAGSSAGDPSAVGPVSRAVRALVGRVRRFQEHTTEVLLDAYGRDMGGE